MVEARRTLLGLSEPPGGLSLEAALKSGAAWAEAIGRMEVRLVSAGTPTPVDSRLARELMTQRARDQCANVDIDSLPGWGTRIRARFPYRPHERERGGQGLRVLIGARCLRAGLSRLLTWTEPGAEVVGEVETAGQALEACQALHPDVALVDLGLPVTGGDRDDSPGSRAGSGVAGFLLATLPELAVVRRTARR